MPLQHGLMHLVAVMDWHSRRVLSWRFPNSLSADFCCEALQEALNGHGMPEIFNTDQGAQFTCAAFLDILRDVEVRISMDGRGRWVGSVFIERLWRTVKYEDVYLRCYEDPGQLRGGLGRFSCYYNEHRPHQALEYKTPAEIRRAAKGWNPETKGPLNLSIGFGWSLTWGPPQVLDFGPSSAYARTPNLKH
jgi:putative transposase